MILVRAEAERSSNYVTENPDSSLIPDVNFYFNSLILNEINIMTKKSIKIILNVFLLSVAFSGKSFSQIDSAAVAILDSMSSVVTSLESCSFELRTEYDISNTRFGLVKHSDKSNVYLKAPDKFFIKREGDKGHKEFYYDGKTLYYYSADNNQYASMPAPPTIMETIDSIQNEYGIEFPASDIFYPDLVDEMLSNSDNLAYLGLTSADDKECHHIAGTNNEFAYQIWISADGSFLPVKMVIVYTGKAGSPQYEALFRNWILNPELQVSMFDFIVPAGAVKIKIIKK